LEKRAITVDERATPVVLPCGLKTVIAQTEVLASATCAA
jgi:hypothetical protein